MQKSHYVFLTSLLLLCLSPLLGQYHQNPQGQAEMTDNPTSRSRITDSSLPAVTGTEFGEPLSGISALEFELFRMGLEDFLEVEDSEEGLGPVYNGRACSQCHATPRIGGSSTVMIVRAGLQDEEGRFQDFSAGSLVQMFSIPVHEVQPQFDPETAVIARRRAPALFGTGLIEAIPDGTLLAMADPEDADGDGISGRVHIVDDPAGGPNRVGRFGWKAHLATAMAFGAEAYRDEMGITNDLFPEEACPVGVDCELLAFIDPVPDPEDAPERTTGLRGIDNFENFLLLLGPPPRGPVNDSALLGEQLFSEIGCGSCHVPELETGSHRISALSRKRFFPYSDFLLHDIGTGDGIQQGDASPQEIRTPPLWGVRVRAPFLHDGRASTLEQAIQMHAGEAKRVRQKFENLEESEKKALLAFLRSL